MDNGSSRFTKSFSFLWRAILFNYNYGGSQFYCGFGISFFILGDLAYLKLRLALVKKLFFILFYYFTYFYYYLYVTLYFWYYLWVLLYYFNYSLALFTVLSRKNFQFQLNKLFLNRHLRVWLNSSTFLIEHILLI